MYRKGGYIVARVAGLLAVLLMAFLLAVQTSYVQTRLSKVALNQLAANMDGRILYDELKVMTNGVLVIRNIKLLDNAPYTEDVNGRGWAAVDTVFSARNITATFTLASLLRKEGLHLGRVTVEDGNFHLTGEPGEYGNNICRIFRIHSSGKPFPTEDLFDLKKLIIRNFRFRMNSFLPEDEPYSGFGINRDDIDLTVDLAGHGLRMSGGKVYAFLDHLTAREKSGYTVNELSTSAEVGDDQILLEDIRFEDPWSELNMRQLSMTYAGFSSFSSFLSDVHLEGEMLRSRLAAQTVAYLTGNLEGSPAVINVRRGGVSGTVSDLHIDRFTFSEEHSGVSAVVDGRVTGLPDTGKLQLDAQVRDLKGTTRDFYRLANALVPGQVPDFTHYASGIPLTLQLRAKGPVDRLDVGGELRSPSGNADISGTLLHLLDPKLPIEANLTLGAQELDLGAMLGNRQLGTVTLATTARTRLSGSIPDTSIDSLYIEKIHALGRDWRGIRVAGTLRDGTAEGRIRSTDPALNLNLSGQVDLVPRTNGSRYVVDGTLNHVDLAALGIDAGGRLSALSTSIQANMLYNGGYLDGEARLPDLNLTTKSGTHPVGQVIVQARRNRRGEQQLDLDTPFLVGHFNGNGPVTQFVRDLLALTVDRELPSLLDRPVSEPSDTIPGYTVGLLFRDSREFLAEMIPGLYIAEGSGLSMNIRQNGELTGRLDSDRLAYGKNYLRSVDLSFDNLQDRLTFRILSSELRAGSFAMLNPSITATADDDRLSVGVRYDSFSGAGGEAELNFDGALSRDEEGVLVVQARPRDSYLITGEERWAVTGDDIVLRDGDLRLDRFLVSNGTQQLLVDGGYSSSHSDTLALKMDRFDLALVDEFLPSQIGIEGKMNGHAILSSGSSLEKLGMLMDFGIDTLRLGGVDAGAVRLSSQWHDEGRELGLRLVDEIEGREALRVDGSYFLRDKSLDVRSSLDHFPLRVAAPFLASFVSELDGGISGSFRASGPLDALVPVSQDLRIEDARARVALTGVAYTLSGPLRVDEGGCYFDELSLTDDDIGRCTIRGSVRFKQLKDFTLRTRIDFNDLKVLDTPERPGAPCYGLLRASGTASATGPLGALVVDANVRTAGDGNVHIPMSAISGGEASSSDLLTFTEPARVLDPYEEMLAALEQKSAEPSDVSVRGRLAIHPGVRAFVEIDKSAGNVASVNGSGTVSVNLRPSKAQFDLGGDYTVNEGSYQFVLPGVLSKTFNVERGSSVKFGGDIMNTELDLTATYDLRTSLDPLVGTSGSNRRPVECSINVTDHLRAPKLNLAIDVPDLDPTTRTSVESALNTTDKVQKQFVSLLLLGSFLPDQGSGIFNQSNLLYSNVVEIMSGQINNILQRLDIPLDVGFGYQQMKTGEDLFDIAVSTQLFEDRVILGGNFGNRRYSTGRSSGDFTGNLDLSVKLDPEGKFRFNVFSHSADEFTSYLDFSQRNGIGVSYQREFGSFRELVQHFFVPKKKRLQEDAPADRPSRPIIINIDNESGETVSYPDSARRHRPVRDTTFFRP